MSQKKYCAAKYQYFKNGNTQQYNIFRNDKYNEYVCKVSCPTEVMNIRRMMGQTGLSR